MPTSTITSAQTITLSTDRLTEPTAQPSGPAKVLLALLAKKPNLVMELYPAAPPRVRWAPGRPDPNTMTAEERLAEVGEILAAGALRMQDPLANE